MNKPFLPAILIITLQLFLTSFAQAVSLNDLFPDAGTDQSVIENLLNTLDQDDMAMLSDRWGTIDDSERRILVPALLDKYGNTARSLQLVYLSTLGRLSDAEGLAYWVLRAEQTGSGYPIETLVPFITNSPEYLSLLKNALANELDLSAFNDVAAINSHLQTLPDEQQNTAYQTLLNQLYQNLFGRIADGPGSAYWIPLLKSGEINLARLVETLINGAIDQDQILLDYKSGAGIRLMESLINRGLITTDDIQNKDSSLSYWSVAEAFTSTQKIFSSYSSSNPQSLLQDLNDLDNNLLSKLFPEYQNTALFAGDNPDNKGYPLAYSNDGQLLVTGQGNGFIKNIQLSGTGSNLSTQQTDSKLHTLPIRDLQLNASQNLFTAGDDNKLGYWTNFWSESTSLQTSSALRSLDIHSNGQQLVFATDTGHIHTWNYAGNNPAELIGDTGSRIYKLLHVPGGNQVVSASANGKIFLWNSSNNTGNILGSMDGAIYDLAISENGRYLYAAGGNLQRGLISIWDLEDHSLIKTLTTHTSTVTALSLSPDMNTLVSGDQSGNIHFWDISDKRPGGFTDQPQKSITNLAGKKIYDLAFHPTQPQIATTDSGQRLRLWDTSNLDQLASISLAGNISGGEDNEVTDARGFSQLAFRSIAPLLSTDELLEQPGLFSNAFALNLDNQTISCPTSGTYTYLFTDNNNDNRYQSANDSFQVTADQCRDNSFTSDGIYTLQIVSATQTTATFNQLNFTENSQRTEFTGTVTFDTQETTSNKTTELNSNNIQVSPADSGQFTYNTLQAEVNEDLISNEKTLSYSANLTVTNSSDNGTYLITPLADLKLSDFEDYPYSGKLRITSTSGVHNGIVATLTVINASQVKMDVDLDGNGIIEHSETYNWSSLSSRFR